MGGQVLSVGERHHGVASREQGGLVVLDDVDAAQERLHRETARVAGAATGGQHVVGPGGIVAERHGAVLADEDRACVVHPCRDLGGILGLDLEVLRGVGVDDTKTCLEVVHQHDRRLLACEGRADPLGVFRCGGLRFELVLDGVRKLQVGGDEDGRGDRVVLGLADQVSGEDRGAGGDVGEDRDLGGAGLGVDGDPAAEQALRGDDVDVAGAGDHRRLGTGLRAKGEHRDRLRAADGIDLVDAEHRAGREDPVVRQAAVVALRRAGDGDRGNAGRLRGHDVHDDAADERREPAGDVQADPLHRHPPLGDRAAVDDLRRGVRAPLVVVDLACALDGDLEGCAYVGVECVQRIRERCRGDAQGRRTYPVEPLPQVEQRLVTPDPDVLDDRAYGFQRGLDVQPGAGQHGREVDRGQVRTAQVDAPNHARGHAPESRGPWSRRP